jgi:PAS domain S-box-containing protein
MTFTKERKIMAGLGTVLLFNGIFMLAFYLSTQRCVEISNEALASADKLSAARDLVWAVELQLRHTRWISIVAGLISTVSVSIAFLVVRGGFRKSQRAEAQLHENEERFRLLVERAREYAILRLDLLGRVETWNAGAERIKGYQAHEVVGQDFSCFYTPEAIQAGAPRRELETALEKGQFQADGWRMRKDGSRFWGNVVITPLRDERGNPIGFSQIFRDLSDQKRAEEAIAELNKTLQRQNLWLVAANGEMESFSYSVSHDLRAPLRSLSGFSQAVLEDYGSRLEPECQRLLNRICAASERMGELIDALLDLSRVTRVEMRLESVDLSSMAREIVEELGSELPKRHVEFVIGDGLVAEGDPRLLRVLLANLLNNSWKFTARSDHAKIEFGRCNAQQGDGRGHGQGDGHIAGQKDGQNETFFVRDNGVGFDMAYSSKLFCTFQRLHSATEFAGTGIGLATVHRIVHRYGGRVWGLGEVDGGAEFRFTLQPEPHDLMRSNSHPNTNLTAKELANVG